MQKEAHFPEYDPVLVQRIREWIEEGRFTRYKRFTRSLDEAIIELCYFNIFKLLEIDVKLDQIVGILGSVGSVSDEPMATMDTT